MKWKSLFFFWFCMALLLCRALPGFAADDAYRAGAYFERGYSAYASAVRVEGDRYRVDVDLQLAAEIAPHAGIASYTLSIDGVAQAVLSPGQNVHGVTLPGNFTGEASVAQTPRSITVVPLLIGGGEAEEEAVELIPERAAGSRIGMTAVVNNPNPEDRLNLRAAPNSQASSLRHYYNGTSVVVLNEFADNWVCVCIGTEGGMARGYMKADYLAFGADEDGVAVMIPTETATVATWTLYGLPDEAAAPLGTYEAGQAFQVLGESTAWQHIAVDGQTGFVRAGAVTAQEAASAPDEAVAENAESTAQPYLESGDGSRMIVYSPPDGASRP